MPDNLHLTVQGNAAVEKELAAKTKQFSTWYAKMRASAAQAIGYRVLCGHVLNEAKESLAHGEFEDYVEKQFGIPKSTQQCWREFSELFLAEMLKTDQKYNVVLLKKSTPRAVEMILELAPRIMDGKGMIEFMRDCKLLAKPKPAGGFRADAEVLAKWLKEFHSELPADTAFEALAPELQEAFKEYYFALPNQPLSDDLIAQQFEGIKTSLGLALGGGSLKRFTHDQLHTVELLATQIATKARNLREAKKTK